MSMILDAIKRSKEVAQGEGSVRSLDTEHYVAADEPLWKNTGFKRASLAALGVMVVVLLFGIYPVEMDRTHLSLRVVIQRRRLRIRRLLILLQRHPRTWPDASPRRSYIFDTCFGVIDKRQKFTAI